MLIPEVLRSYMFNYEKIDNEGTFLNMRILITNDDGIDADGIKSLKKIALEISSEENIFVVAPSSNQSAKVDRLPIKLILR